MKIACVSLVREEGIFQKFICPPLSFDVHYIYFVDRQRDIRKTCYIKNILSAQYQDMEMRD